MDNTTNQNLKQAQVNDDMLSLREILDMVLNNWKWFLVSAIVCLAIARIYLATKSNIYQRQAVMLVKDDTGTGGSRRAVGTDALMQLNGVMTGSSVKNEVYILRSHMLMKEVVRKLHLDVLYTQKHRLQDVSLYDVKPFSIQFQESEDSVIVASFNVEVLNKRECKLNNIVTRDGEIDYNKIVRFGQMVKTPVGKLIIVPVPEYLDKFEGKTIAVTHLNIERAANMIGGRISAGEVDRESTLVRIVCTDTNIQRADDILAALLEAYKRSIIQDKNLLAQSTADFIDERIKIISKDLSRVEGEMASFKQRNNLVDLSQNAQNYLAQSNTARQRTIQLQAQQASISYLLNHLRSASQGNTLIPMLGGLTDAGVQSQIQRYNDLMLQRNHLVENSGEGSSSIKEMDANLRQMKQAVIASVQGYKASVDLQTRQAQHEEQNLQGSLATVPQKEKEIIDINRQQSIKETLYTYLLNKREETALQLAIQEANIRVVEQPFGSLNPIAPRRMVINCAALLIGLLLPFVVLYLINLLNMGVRGRKDVETYTTIPVIGEIPRVKHDKKDTNVVVDEQSNDAVSEAFRMLRFNLTFVNKDARVIMFTSTMPGEGKTFVSRNYAYTLSLMGKKVILVDADIRKRTQSSLYGVQRKAGLTSYLSGTVENLEEMIIRGTEQNKVDILPAGVLPPNPAELLMSERLETLITELKKSYDYIVIDNVPAQVVADAGIVNRVADCTIYVVRDHKLDRRYLPELERLYQEKKFNNLCVLINDSKLEKKRYGYGYGRYGYGYGYGYGNDKKKKRFSLETLKSKI